MQTITETQKDNLTLSTDPDRLDIDAVCSFLSQAYWADTRSRATIERSLKNSLVFAVYDGDRQVAMARVVTDFATFAWLCDVFVHPDYRGRGISKWMMRDILAHPDLQGLRRWILASTTARGLYSQFGFIQLQHPERWMELFDQAAT
jgi:N-acetylglutamate synthase-like GNAT family acetyltransferase